MKDNIELNALNGILKFLGISFLVIVLFFGFYKVSFGAVTDDANWATITWTSTVNSYLSSYNYDTATIQSTNSSANWGAFSVATWTAFFGSFTHIRMFDGNCTGLTMAQCESASSGYKDYWVDGSNWTDEDPTPDPVYGCTDPEANNYDPEATDDDDSCTYDTELPEFLPIYSLPFEQFLIASSTCTQTSSGTTTPVTYECNATSTSLDVPTYHDWLLFSSLMLFVLSPILFGQVFNIFKT